ncbi:UbiA family prenyltransferase [Methylorubrum extorquens]|uniref:UbiA family prenyltransferase n=1 Tax=Methylorubrum extorquens TaxID=408 RepID=A0AAX3WA88_METEX|nr:MULTISPECIES: UbiA family prenyltransferase [Methylobacteriaceae]KQO96265.1 prenyltransferase [Methylobacterium sp. Leaf92]KQQ06992.1 prenyltransferase [Methylobacterium sp. Leaf122]UYW30736.1 UbiA family prenyltransferase [Methylorubrum extorquens]WHQ68173.1 UbiA family prenyltransferase [Methylorubrum extorquens]
MATAHARRAEAAPILIEDAASALRPVPLVIDLDGTLLRTDLLLEGIIALLRRNPLMLLVMLLWLPRGRAFFKRRIAEGAVLDVATLPANAALLAHIEAQKAAGQEIVLATAADELMALRALRRFPVFDRVVASDGVRNLKGEAKAAQLRALYPQGFDYAGDAAADLPVWAAARRVIVVGASGSVLRAARRLGKPVEEFPAASRSRALLKALRLHQWAKNALVFVPLVLGGRAGDAQAWGSAVLAFLALGLVASASYLLNDLLDLSHDRAHWSKRERPLASGRLPIATGLAAIVLGLAGGLAVAAWAGAAVLTGVLAYLALTLTYSAWLKRVPMLDALTLGSLFSLRIAVGVAAVAVAWSPWLLTFSMFLFTSLSFAKRHTELRGAARRGQAGTIAGRGYEPADEPVVLAFGIASGLASVVIFILYLANEAFRHAALAAPLALWSFPLILVLFMGRVWLLAGRDALHDDPVAFAVRDRPSLVLAGVAGLAFAVAAFGLPPGLLPSLLPQGFGL